MNNTSTYRLIDSEDMRYKNGRGRVVSQRNTFWKDESDAPFRLEASKCDEPGCIAVAANQPGWFVQPIAAEIGRQIREGGVMPQQVLGVNFMDNIVLGAMWDAQDEVLHVAVHAATSDYLRYDRLTGAPAALPDRCGLCSAVIENGYCGLCDGEGI